MTQGALASRLGASTSHVSNLERGHRDPALTLLPVMDDALETGTRFQDLWDDLTGTGRPGWLDEIAGAVQAASAVYEYQVLAFPAHLQTEDYARALVKHGAPWLTPDDVEARVAERMARAKHMADAVTPKLWLVFDESLLYRRYGGAEAARTQLAHMAELAERERVTFQVIPLDTVKHPGNSGAFSVIVSPDNPDAVYVESAREGHSVTAADDVAQHRMLFAALQGLSLGPDTSLARVQDEIRRIDGT